MLCVCNTKYFAIYHHRCLFWTPSKFINYPGSSFSSTFQDLKLSFPGLSRAWKILGKNPGLSRMRGNTVTIQHSAGTHSTMHTLKAACTSKWLPTSTVKYVLWKRCPVLKCGSCKTLLFHQNYTQMLTMLCPIKWKVFFTNFHEHTDTILPCILNI